jgi:hypothetical protein
LEVGSWEWGELESWRAGELESWRAGELESWSNVIPSESREAGRVEGRAGNVIEYVHNLFAIYKNTERLRGEII